MTPKPDNCLNCGSDISQNQDYCPACGQNTDAHVLGVGEFISTWWNSMFNLDGTVFKTLKYIWAPWKLAAFYVEGKRKSFLHPMRVFLVLLLFYFGYLVSKVNVDNNKTRSNEEYAILERSRLLQSYTHLRNSHTLSPEACSFADTIESKLFGDTHLPEKDTFLNSTFFDLGDRKYPITRQDAISLDRDSIYHKYGVTGFWDKIIVGQTIRMNLDRAGTINYAIGNAAWGVLALIIIMAGFLKLLYWRQKMHYVAHLVLLLNVHSVIFFLLLMFAIIFGILGKDDQNHLGLYSLIVLIIVFLSMYKYYGQGLMKTTLKFFIASTFYVIFGLIIVFSVSLGSLAFF
jgi:hypothetical protein